MARTVNPTSAELRSTVYGLSACGLAAFVALCGCRPAEPASDRPLSVVISGDTAGWIVPCGCTTDQYGGLPRRASYLAALGRERETISADAGGAPHGISPYDKAKFEAIVRGERAMGVAAHNIGAAEALLGAEYLRRLVDEFGLPLVSANVRTADGRPLAEPLRIITASGRRVALVGVLSAKFATPAIRVDPPGPSILDALHEAAGRYDSVIVLAYLPEDELRGLAASLPEADAVVGGPTGQAMSPRSVGPTLLASATNKGKFVVRLDAPARAADRWTGAVVAMNETLADDPGQLANLRSYYEELGRRDFTPAESGARAAASNSLPENYRVAGTAECRKCHPADSAAWLHSKHATAWASLVKSGAQVDPDCQRCHTTGYGLPGGFVSVGRSPATTGVGCESCHGPSAGHAIDPKVSTLHRGRARDQCIACHDPENSPRFAYEKYWAEIRHGGAPASATPPVDSRRGLP
jgi:hypothetical protein